MNCTALTTGRTARIVGMVALAAVLVASVVIVLHHTHVEASAHGFVHSGFGVRVSAVFVGESSALWALGDALMAPFEALVGWFGRLFSVLLGLFV